MPENEHLWMEWATLELERGNIGDYQTRNSAAWIYKEACINRIRVSNSPIWYKWASFAHQYPMYDIDGTFIDEAYVSEKGLIIQNRKN